MCRGDVPVPDGIFLYVHIYMLKEKNLPKNFITEQFLICAPWEIHIFLTSIDKRWFHGVIVICNKICLDLIETEDKEGGVKEQKKLEAPAGGKMDKRMSKTVNKYVSI